MVSNCEKEDPKVEGRPCESDLDEKSYLAVVTALSVGAHGVSLQGACGGVAARVHAFLGQGKENKSVNNMWT